MTLPSKNRLLTKYQRTSLGVLSLCMLVIVSIPSSYAHIPLQGEGYGVSDALLIEDPLKSWVIYTEYRDARPLYYKFNLSAGDRLKTGLLTVEQDFVPDLTILGPGFSQAYDDHFHEAFEIPEGYGIVHIHGEVQIQKDYEPFTPSSYYQVVSNHMINI